MFASPTKLGSSCYRLQWRSQPYSPGWAMVSLSCISRIFSQISINISYFSSNSPYFHLQLGPPSGRVAPKSPGYPTDRLALEAGSNTLSALARRMSSVRWHSQIPQCSGSPNVLSAPARAMSSVFRHAQCPHRSSMHNVISALLRTHNVLIVLSHIQYPQCSGIQNILIAPARTMSSVVRHAKCPQCYSTHNVLNSLAGTIFTVFSVLSALANITSF